MNESKMDLEMKRDLHPHAEAFLAMLMRGNAYSKQRKGCMGFWDKLSEYDKKHFSEYIDEILRLPRAKDYKDPV